MIGNRRYIWRLALFAYGVLNAVLYASLLPLWEGFDEPFHYAYVQTLSQFGTVPRLGTSAVPAEICRSLVLAPASHVVKHNLPMVTTFDEFFRLAHERRLAARNELTGLRPVASWGDCGLNYEAHQAPAAYVLLSVPDRLLTGVGLTRRVWLLRLLCGVVAALTTAAALLRLATLVGISDAVAHLLVFVVLSGQMFYATTCHICNDWLAVPLMVLTFERLIAAWESATTRCVLLLAATLAAGLLTKAYFLAVLPVVFGALLAAGLRRRLSFGRVMLFWAALLVLAGPWYLRNLGMAGNLSGMQETKGGVPGSQILSAVFHIPWLTSAKDLAYASLWTGNNSFTTFSWVVLSMLLAGYLVAAAGAVWRQISFPSAAGRRIVFWGCVTYGAALAYSIVVSYWASGSAITTTSPWYVQPIAPVALVAIFAGTNPISRSGRVVAIWIAGWTAYVFCATFWAKLIPLYGGLGGGRTTLRTLAAWYGGGWPAIAEVLGGTAMCSAAWVCGLALVSSVGTVVLALCCCRNMWQDPA